MKRVAVRLVILFACAIASPLVANAVGRSVASDRKVFKGFVQIDKNRELFVEHLAAEPGRATVVLLNGLTYRVGSWDSFVDKLQGDGLGILQYDPMGQGETLLKYAPALGPYQLDDQVRDLVRLLRTLNIQGPYHFVALSYGGAIGMSYAALYPQKIASLILMAPFIAPLASQDVWIRMQIAQTRILFPLNQATDDELYDYFLRQIVYSTYPSAEPIVLENQFKLEATYRLVQGVRKFNALNVVHQFPSAKVHLILARQDQYIANEVHDAFWSEVPAQARASRLYIQGTEHKIPESVPSFAAAWTKLIVEGDARISGDRTYMGSAWMGTAASEDTKIRVTEEAKLRAPREKK